MSYVNSHLIYGIALWGPMLTDTQKGLLKNMLKSIIKQSNILECHSEKILTLEQVITLSQLEYIYKTMHQLNPIQSRITLQIGQSRRKPKNLILPRYNSELYHKSLFHSSIILWNNLDDKAQNSSSIYSLRNKYKKMYKNIDLTVTNR